MTEARAATPVPYAAEASFKGRPALEDTPSRLPLLFVALSLIALAAIPVLVERRTREAEEEVSQVFDAARDLSADLALLLAREMSRFQAYLVTGDPVFRERYLALREEEDVVYQELLELLEPTDLAVREDLAALSSVVGSWQVNHGLALKGNAERLEYLTQIQAEEQRYDEVLAASQTLREGLATEMRAARAQMDQAQSIQVDVTVGLVLLALFATAVVAALGGRFRSLVAESEWQKDDALKARREMRAVLEATGDGVLGLDLEGRCASLNKTGSRLLGYAEVEALGRNVHELFHGHAPQGAGHAQDECPLLMALNSDASERHAEDTLWRRDGSAFPARWQLRPLLGGGAVKGAVVTLTDMTAVREAESALRQALHARDQVVAVVSHDLRNPLGTIAAAADLIVELELPEDKKAEQLQIIRRTTTRMSRLIEDLLDVSRIEAGGLSVELEPLDMGALVREALELQGPQAQERQVELAMDVEPGLPRVRGDHHRILQVFSNLLGNALKHTPRGGRVTVSTRADGSRVLVQVRDTGDGIEREHLAHLFDRFWQARRTDRSGAGLGLAIVKAIVEAHEGRVWADSEPGKGSVFSFTLPLHDDGTRGSARSQGERAHAPGLDGALATSLVSAGRVTGTSKTGGA